MHRVRRAPKKPKLALGAGLLGAALLLAACGGDLREPFSGSGKNRPTLDPRPPAPLEKLRSPLTAVSALPVTAGTWQSVGPGPWDGDTPSIPRNVTGAIHTVVAHPTDPNTLWIGAVNGGVWRTTDALATSPTWTPLTDGLPTLAIGALELDPTDPTHKTLLAGTGQTSPLFRNTPLIGALRSTDGGNSWTVLNSAGALGHQSVTGVAARGSVLLAATSSPGLGFFCGFIGMYRSSDSGATFTQISGASDSGLPNGDNLDLVGDPSDPSVLYTNVRADASCAPGGQSGIYKSTDVGATWTKVSTAAMDALMGTFATFSNGELAVGRSGQVYAAVINSDPNLPGNSSRLTGLFRSGDAGLSWIALDVPNTHPGGQGWVHFSIVADPNNPQLVYVGGDGGMTRFRVDASKPSGRQVSPLQSLSGSATGSSPHADSREMVFDATGSIIETDDGGIYRRTNPGGNQGDWYSLNGNLRLTEMVGLAYDTVSNTVHVASQDNGTAMQAAAGSASWLGVSGGDGCDIQIDDRSSPIQSTRYYSSHLVSNFTRGVYSASGELISAATPAMTVVGGGPPFSGNNFVPPVRVNAVDPQRLLFGVGNFYESFDRADTLHWLGGQSIGLCEGLVYGGWAGGVANPDLIYAINSAQVYLRTSGTGAPTRTADPGPPGRLLGDIVVDKADWHNAYVLDQQVIVWATSDAGNTWTDVTGNLTTATTQLRRLVYVKGSPDILVASGQGAVFRMALDNPGVWTQLGTGLPDTLVGNLVYDPVDDVLLAGTVGRGAWKFSGGVANRPAGLTVDNPLIVEGDSGTQSLVFTVALTQAAAQTVTVGFATGAGTPNPATVGSDYLATSGTLSFSPGETQKTVSVAIVGDKINEPDETVALNLSNPVNAGITRGQGVGVIIENDIPRFGGTITDAQGVALSGVVVFVFDSNGIYVGQADTDLQGRYLTPRLPPGTYFATTNNYRGFIEQRFSQQPCSNCDPLGGTPIAVAAAAATTGIDFSLTRGGRITGTVRDELTNAPLDDVTVNFYDSGGSRLAYVLTDTAGGYSSPGLAQGSYRVATNNSNGYVDELFDDIPCSGCAAGPGAPVAVTVGQVTGGIDFGLSKGSVLSISSAGVTEGNSGTINAVFTVTLVPVSSPPTVTVNYGTQNGTAVAASDYTATSGTLSFPPGTTSRTISVPVRGDTLDEADETFSVVLSGATNARIGGPPGLGTITDNDPTPTLSVNSVSVNEGNAGTSNATFAVNLSAASGRSVSVNFATADKTALAGSDYSATSGSLTFAPGTVTQPVVVGVLGDQIAESNEQFLVNLSQAVNASIATGQGTGTIVDDDGLSLAPVADAYVRNGSAGSNFGRATTIEVKNTTSSGLTRRGLLRFDLASVGASSVRQATLRLFVTAIDKPNPPLSVLSLANDTWSETAVTWNNQPPAGGSLASTTIAAAGAVVNLDVTTFVNSQLAGDKKASFELVQASSSANVLVTLASREATTTTQRPALVIAR